MEMSPFDVFCHFPSSGHVVLLAGHPCEKEKPYMTVVFIDGKLKILQKNDHKESTQLLLKGSKPDSVIY